MFRTLSFLIAFLMSTQLWAQQPELDYLEFDDNMKSVVKLECIISSNGFPSSASGSGVIIEKSKVQHPKYDFLVKGKILTARHVVEDAVSIKGIFRDKSSYTGFKIVAQSPELYDLAIVEGWVSKNATASPVARKRPKRGDVVKLAGFPFGGKLKYWKAPVKRVVKDDSHVFVDEDCQPGASGGPIFNGNNEIVGIISGGLRWFNEDDKPMYTWPTRAPCTGPICQLMDLIGMFPVSYSEDATNINPIPVIINGNIE